MIVCVCHRVSDRDIARAVRDGCDSFEALQDELRVATGCGRCHDCAQDTFAVARACRTTVAEVREARELRVIPIVAAPLPPHPAVATPLAA